MCGFESVERGVVAGLDWIGLEETYLSIALDNTRSLIRRRTRIMRTICHRGARVRQLRPPRHIKHTIPQRGVQLKHLRAINIHGIRVRRRRTQWYIPGARGQRGGQVVRGGDLVFESDLYEVFGDGDGAEGPAGWVYAGDAGDEEVGGCEGEGGGVD